MNVDEHALGEYLQCVGSAIGDRRTGRTVRGVIEGIIGGETLRCSQIAVFSPYVQG